jgi:hypothetical protein
MEAIYSSEYRFLQEPHSGTSQKMAFFIVITLKTSNLTTIMVLVLARYITFSLILIMALDGITYLDDLPEQSIVIPLFDKLQDGTSRWNQ